MPSAESKQAPTLAERFRGALLGVAIGDALGARLEGGPMRERSSLLHWISEPPHPLRFTDDTHMTLATARSLVECGGFDDEHMGELLARYYEREPWRGYGAGPPQVFGAARSGRPWRELASDLFGGAGSFGNGAAMRISPIGLFYHRQPKRAAAIAQQAAQITHAHPIGIDGAVLQATAVAAVLTTESGAFNSTKLIDRLKLSTTTRRFRELLDSVRWLGAAPPTKIVQLLGHGIEAHRSVATALYAFFQHRDSFEESMLFALSLGGDADTIASMTGALAGAWLGTNGIPDVWKTRVEGAPELLHLADQLLELAPPAL